MSITKHRLKNLSKLLEKSGKLSSDDIQSTIMGRTWYKGVLYETLDVFRAANPNAKIGKIHGIPITGLPGWTKKYL